MFAALLKERLAAFAACARFAIALSLSCGVAGMAQAQIQTITPWSFAGGGIENTRATLSPSGPYQINPISASKLKVKWTFTTHGAITATPTVEQGGLYVTDWAGMLYKIDPSNGAPIWSYPLSIYTGVAGAGKGSRSSPAIGSLGEIVLGDTTSPTIISVNRTTGKLIWKAVVDTHPNALIHGSAVIYNGIVYVGVGSNEEGVTKTNANYIPTFRGSLVALDEATGKILWQFYMVPPGYAGAAIWNTQPIIFAAGHSVIVATGNNYWVPATVQACILNSGSTREIQASEGVKCLDPADQVDSLVSLDLTTGFFNWTRKFTGPDTFNGACEVGFSTCPNPEGKDVDFASSPNLIMLPGFTGVADDVGGVSNGYLLGAGQKSGIYWAVNPFDGGIFWGNFVGDGEIKWGTAVGTDNNPMAFVAINNANEHLNNLLAGVNGVSQYWNAGSWGSINLSTGKMIWQIPAYGTDLKNTAYGAAAPSAMSYSNHVIFASASSGYVVALDSATGTILWTYNMGGTVESAPAIYNDTLYWGIGKGTGTAGKLYAFFTTPK